MCSVIKNEDKEKENIEPMGEDTEFKKEDENLNPKAAKIPHRESSNLPTLQILSGDSNISININSLVPLIGLWILLN